MIDIIITFLSYAKLLITFSFFTYVYKYFYDSCSEKKIIKSKNGNLKKVVKIRTSLSIIYLFLFSLFFYLLNFYVIITLVFAILLLGIILVHKFEPSVLNILKKYDTSPVLIKCWSIFSLIFNTIFKILGPLHRLIDIKIKKLKDIVKNKVLAHYTNIDFSLFNNATNNSSGIGEFSKLFDSINNEKKHIELLCDKTIKCDIFTNNSIDDNKIKNTIQNDVYKMD